LLTTLLSVVITGSVDLALRASSAPKISQRPADPRVDGSARCRRARGPSALAHSDRLGRRAIRSACARARASRWVHCHTWWRCLPSILRSTLGRPPGSGVGLRDAWPGIAHRWLHGVSAHRAEHRRPCQ